MPTMLSYAQPWKTLQKTQTPLQNRNNSSKSTLALPHTVTVPSSASKKPHCLHYHHIYIISTTTHTPHIGKNKTTQHDPLNNMPAMTTIYPRSAHIHCYVYLAQARFNTGLTMHCFILDGVIPAMQIGH
jgi:hypothetical protein